MTGAGMTSDEARSVLMARRFVSLADSLVDDYDVVDLLDRLVRTCIELLDVSAAGLLILDRHGKLQPIAASSEETQMIELLQLQNDEGPCLETIVTGEAVTDADLQSARGRWPTFANAALQFGFRSVHSVPLRLREVNLGALNLFSGGQPALDQFDRTVAQALADIATIAILQQRSRDRASRLADQLQQALNSRIVIEQAKGLIAERGTLRMDQAFEVLRSWSRAHNRKLSEVAGDLVAGLLSSADVLQGRAQDR